MTISIYDNNICTHTFLVTNSYSSWEYIKSASRSFVQFYIRDFLETILETSSQSWQTQRWIYIFGVLLHISYQRRILQEPLKICHNLPPIYEIIIYIKSIRSISVNIKNSNQCKVYLFSVQCAWLLYWNIFCTSSEERFLSPHTCTKPLFNAKCCDYHIY